MGDWLAAKRMLDNMVFPATEFKRVATSRDGGRAVRYSYTHSKGKRHSGQGNKTVVANIAVVGGFPSDAWELYCTECNKVYEMGMVVFNNESSSCYVRKFTEERDLAATIDELDGGLGIG